MIETVAQIFGMAFIGIIIICIVWTFGSYVIRSSESQNDDLLDNMNKMDKQGE